LEAVKGSGRFCIATIAQPLALPAGFAHKATLGKSLAIFRDVCDDGVHILYPLLRASTGNDCLSWGIFFWDLEPVSTVIQIFAPHKRIDGERHLTTDGRGLFSSLFTLKYSK
jgi:hypothetical protein